MNIEVSVAHRGFKKSMSYLVPKRITLACNPKIIAWLFWNIYFKEENKGG